MVRACGRVLALVGEGENGDVLMVLEASGFDVLAVRSGEEALARAAGERPCAVLLDLDGNESSGFLACKILRERNGELPIVLLSGERTTASDRVVALLLGADDYLVKPIDPSELAARLHRLVGRFAANGVTTAVASDEAVVDDFDLTKRERQVMVRLFDGLTQSDIAKELVISPNTVATHIQHILSKLGVHTRAQAVAKVAHAGWLARERAREEPSPPPLLAEAPTTSTAGTPVAAPRRRRASAAPAADQLTSPRFELESQSP